MLLVSILGDFHSSLFPLYNEFKNQISHHIVVEDDAFNKQNKHRKIIKSLQNFNKKKHLSIKTEAFIIDEDSKTSIQKLVKRIHEIEINMQNVYLNTTDGLANIGLLLGMELMNDGANFLSYDMHENSYNLMTKKSMKNIPLRHSLCIVDHFELKGLRVQSKGDKEFAHTYKRQILELFNNYHKELEQLNKDIGQQKILKVHKYPRAYQLLKSMKLDLVRDATLITGGLFEYYVYLLLKDLPFDDIEIGVIVEQALNDEIGIKNEFDILLMKNNHLHMIECKFRKNFLKQDIVYKYAALINFIDDDSHVMIVTNDLVYQHNIYDKNNFHLQNQRRAFLNRIALRGSVIHHKKEFLQEVKSLFLQE